MIQLVFYSDKVKKLRNILEKSENLLYYKKHISDIFCYLWLFFRRKLTRVTRVESPRISELYQRAGLSRNELYMPKNWLNPIGIFLLKQMLSYLSLFQDGCLIRRDWEEGGWGRGNFFWLVWRIVTTKYYYLYYLDAPPSSLCSDNPI